MSKSYLPAQDKELLAWGNNFLQVAENNIALLGLTSSDFTAVTADVAFFGGDLDTITGFKAQLDGTVKLKDTHRAAVRTDIRSLVKRIQAHPGVTDALKAQLGITVPAVVPNKTPPVMPTTVVVNGLPTGINTLKWKSIGNKQATQYVILAKPLTMGARAEDSTGWAMVGQTTKRKFDHKGITPGAPIAYRIVAERADMSSDPSLPVTIYTS